MADTHRDPEAYIYGVVESLKRVSGGDVLITLEKVTGAVYGIAFTVPGDLAEWYLPGTEVRISVRPHKL